MTGLKARVAALKRFYPVSLLLRSIDQYGRGDSGSYAAALAYYGVASLFPLLVVLVAIFGLIARDAVLQQRAIQLIVDRIPDSIRFRDEIEVVVLGVSRSNNGLLGSIGLLGTIWGASEMFAALRRALNVAFQVPRPRGYVRGKLIDLYCVFVTIALVLFGVAANAGLDILQDWGAGTPAAPYLALTRWAGSRLVPFLVLYGVLLLVFRLLPDVEVRVADLWQGALVATIGFESVRIGFGYYVGHFAWFGGAYGTIGGIVAFLFFVYVLASILIFAAVVTSIRIRDAALQRALAAPAPAPVR